ncbi:MAG: hypothetical protein ABI569_11250, partial [Casimicrobiaceae bacterium]
ALREGVIIDYLREIETEELPPVPDVDNYRLKDVFAIGRRYGYEESHALQVADLAEKIFDALAPIYNLRRHGHRVLLRARQPDAARLARRAAMPRTGARGRRVR